MSCKNLAAVPTHGPETPHALHGWREVNETHAVSEVTELLHLAKNLAEEPLVLPHLDFAREIGRAD